MIFRDMISYDQNMQVQGKRKLVFVPYPEGRELMDCGNGECACADEHRQCGYCTELSRTDRRTGWWKEAP